MSSPVKPADVAATVPDPNSTLCGNFIGALLKLPALLSTWWAWAFDSSGNSTKAWVNTVLRTGDLVMAACLQNEDGTRLLCDGREVSQTTYPDLFLALGTTYGTASDPVHNFRIPDYRARFPCGIGSFPSSASVALGVAGGEEKHTLLQTEMPAATGTGLPNGATGVWVREPGLGTTNLSSSGGNQDGLVTLAAGSNTPHNNVPPFLGVYVYIVC